MTDDDLIVPIAGFAIAMPGRIAAGSKVRRPERPSSPQAHRAE